jgi:hypothetical protein
MSANLLSAQTVAADKPLAVSFRLLLGLYLIIPVCLILHLSDTLFWQHALRQQLPGSPTHYLLFQILFGTPHIVASTIILVSNRDYLNLYKPKLLAMTLGIALIFGLGSLVIPHRILYLTVAFWTVFHVLKQQHGLARGICKLPDYANHWLLGLSVAAGFFIYVGIFLKNSLSTELKIGILSTAGLLCLALIALTVHYQRQVQTLFGKSFLWANSALLISSFYLYSQHYYFLAILVPRLVHDATAYIFYVTHDYNKHRHRPRNLIYQHARRWHIHIFLVLPLLSFGLTYLLQAYGDIIIDSISRVLFGTTLYKVVTMGFIGYLGLMHYYTESFTWKQDSPYRRYIAFTI